MASHPWRTLEERTECIWGDFLLLLNKTVKNAKEETEGSCLEGQDESFLGVVCTEGGGYLPQGS